MWEYAARLNRVIDGDTVVLDMDLGFHITLTEHIRLLRIDCPEISTAAGRDARAYAQAWFAAWGGACVVTTTKPQRQTFARWLGEVTSPDGASNLADALRLAGFVKAQSLPL